MAEDTDNIEYDVYDFGLRIKALRKRRNLTQVQLGNKIGVKKDSISSYENNTKRPSTEHLKKLAIVLHVSVDYLLGMENAMVIKLYDLPKDKDPLLQNFLETFVYPD